MVNITTPKETIKPASPPVNVLSPILPNGKSLPIIAANESPIAKKIKAETAIAISKENTVMVHPKRSHVAPVKLPFDSLTRSMDPNQ